MGAVTACPLMREGISYFRHQAEGIEWMQQRASFILGDEMGLGKTLQVLTVIAQDFHAGLAKRALIVAPATLKWNWEAEIDKFTHIGCEVIVGSPAKRKERYAESTAPILIVGYETVVSDLGHLNALEFDIVAYDEAHYIKTHTSKRSRSCRRLRGSRHFLITGSPLLNQANDLWALLNRVDEDRWPRYYHFENRFCVFGGYRGKQIVGVKNHDELNAMLDEVMLRRRKEDVLDLPAKMRASVVVGLTPLQRKLYDEAKDDLRIGIPENPDGMEIQNALVKLLKLKQICGTPATITWTDDEGNEFSFADESEKLDVAQDRISELVDNGERVVVFTQFRGVLDAMVKRLEKRRHTVFVLTGDTKQQDRVGVVESWSKSEGGVIVCMLQVAAVGLNMTAASTAIFLDKLWTPKLNEQAEDRLHRIGAERPIEIISLLCKGTVEDRVETILRRKEELFGLVVEGDPEWRRRLIAAVAQEEIAS